MGKKGTLEAWAGGAPWGPQGGRWGRVFLATFPAGPGGGEGGGGEAPAATTVGTKTPLFRKRGPKKLDPLFGVSTPREAGKRGLLGPGEVWGPAPWREDRPREGDPPEAPIAGGRPRGRVYPRGGPRRGCTAKRGAKGRPGPQGAGKKAKGAKGRKAPARKRREREKGPRRKGGPF